METRDLDIQEVPLGTPFFRRKVESFLSTNGLRLEDVDFYCTIQDAHGDIVAGGGLKGDVIKCIAVSEVARSEGLSMSLVSRLVSVGADRGFSNLKVFTKPENEGIFSSFGFHTLARAPKAVLMENGRGLEEYVADMAGQPLRPGEVHPRFAAAEYRLSRTAAPAPGLAEGPKTGVIVMNANPFTLGHLYLVEQASRQVDRLFIIPVRDGDSMFPYEERLAMIKASCNGLAEVLEGSSYQISAATFPKYFLKDLDEASETQARLDLDLFARHIAPALGATVRFVGSEPLDPLTARYNALMKEILPASGIEVVEIPRLGVPEVNMPVSASLVRRVLSRGSFLEAASMTPPSTWPYLVAELIARALRMELDTPLKPGLVDRTSSGAHSDMDYALMSGSIDVIRHSFVRNLRNLYLTDNQSDNNCLLVKNREGEVTNLLDVNELQITGSNVGCNLDIPPHDLVAFGKAIEADVLAFTGGVNTYRGAIFALGLASVAFLDVLRRFLQVADNQGAYGFVSGKISWTRMANALNINDLQKTLQSRIAELSAMIGPSAGTHGGTAVKEHGVKGALQMAREGYRPLFEDWLPYYRGCKSEVSAEAGKGFPVKPRMTSEKPEMPEDVWRLQRTLLRIMSQLDDTCVIHRVGFERAQEVKEEAKALLEVFEADRFPVKPGMTVRPVGELVEPPALRQAQGPEMALRKMTERYNEEGISPGGAADMLALTVLADSLLG